jgi:hypothetical protein
MGSTLVPTAIGIMSYMTDTFTKLAQGVGRHPDLFRALGIGIGILAASLAVVGIVAVIGAIGPAGWIAGGITALALAVTFIPWKEAFDGLIGGIMSIARALHLVSPTPGGSQGAQFFRHGIVIPHGVPSIQAPHFETPGGAIMVPPRTGIRGGGGITGPRSDIGGFQPASIRYNHPGAQYPSAAAAAFGMQGYGIIGGGHQIARFPDPGSGAAANMDLFYRNYTGMTLGAAGAKWTGGSGFGVPGYDSGMVVTKDMMHDENFTTALMKGIAKREAGRPSPVTAEQWHEGFDKFRRRRGFGDMTPPAKEGAIHMDMPVYLDGAKIAHATMKQMVAGFNRSAGGSRTPDYTSTRPQAV